MLRRYSVGGRGISGLLGIRITGIWCGTVDPGLMRHFNELRNNLVDDLLLFLGAWQAFKHQESSSGAMHW